MLKPSLNEIQKLAKDKHNENKKVFRKVKKESSQNLDYIMQSYMKMNLKNELLRMCQLFNKTTGPLFTSADIERIAKF